MEDFQQTFPELDSVEALTKLDENEMKSAKGKERWRNFIMKVSERLASESASLDKMLIIMLGSIVREARP